MKQVKSKENHFSMSNSDGNIIIIKRCVDNNLSSKKNRHTKTKKNKRRTLISDVSKLANKPSLNVDCLSPVKSIDPDQTIYRISLHLFDSDYIDRLQSIIVMDEKSIFEKLSDSINKKARYLMNLLIT